MRMPATAARTERNGVDFGAWGFGYVSVFFFLFSCSAKEISIFSSGGFFLLFVVNYYV
jgi:hypothetical protein